MMRLDSEITNDLDESDEKQLLLQVEKYITQEKPQALILEHADNHAARFCAEVDGDIGSRHVAYRIRTPFALQSVG